ncbi:MAG: DUF1015 domain-containing protein [Myxococcales bacterium]|nr:DUF1015 domain-containing protein [Myxococcales bacterium]
MVMVKAFRALRPSASLVREVASPPYDVINTREARALAASKPASFLHVSRPEIDLPEGVDEHDPAVYLRAVSNLRGMINAGALVRDAEAHLYLYAQTMGAHRQVGVVGCVSVDEYDCDVIRKHEKTRADKEDDRTLHVHALAAHDEPVFLAYRAEAAIDGLVARVTAEAPTWDFVTDDGVGHTFWVLSRSDSERLEGLFAGVETLYVADGHHRSAAASRVHALRAGEGGEHDRFLAVVFPDDQLQILPYHRLVRDTRGRSPEALLAALGAVLDLEPVADAQPTAARSVGLFVGGRWYRGRFHAATRNDDDPVARLDASWVQDHLLAGLFGIDDPRRDKNVDFVGGIRGTAALEARVRDEGWSLAIAMYPTSMAELLAVSDAGRLMPPKSTWFEPKLRSGLFVHTL